MKNLKFDEYSIFFLFRTWHRWVETNADRPNWSRLRKLLATEDIIHILVAIVDIILFSNILQQQAPALKMGGREPIASAVTLESFVFLRCTVRSAGPERMVETSFDQQIR